mmetsp:Transcript_13148/g.22254  ORF Transcript_13148/g.22254 Transcript_13148/m.22254 type:complete len:108 (-) Transcript_13148:2869-3192(-)
MSQETVKQYQSQYQNAIAEEIDEQMRLSTLQMDITEEERQPSREPEKRDTLEPRKQRLSNFTGPQEALLVQEEGRALRRKSRMDSVAAAEQKIKVSDQDLKEISEVY